MADEYRVVYLSAGQQAPVGSTGIMLPDGGIVWKGEAGAFPDNASLGNNLSTDPEFDTTYMHSLVTQAELAKYNAILNAAIEDPV